MATACGRLACRTSATEDQDQAVLCTDAGRPSVQFIGPAIKNSHRLLRASAAARSSASDTLGVVSVEPVRWELVNPEGAARPAMISPVRRPAALAGATIGLAWNGKPGGDVALNEIAKLLAEQVPDARFVRYWQTLPESVSERELSSSVIESMAAARPDVVVVSQAD
jgi:hypothetical protein